MALRILIVDDALFMRNVLKDIFLRAGFEIAGEAADGVEAVQAYRDLEPDLVTMDIVMPLLSGVEATEEICRYDPQARVVMCSALGQEPLLLAAVKAGARDFIVKPFIELQVLEVVRRVSDGAGEITCSQ
ncbi:MAG: response regulator [Desulfuromonadales bacterium]|nr:response regulator [Desulfuromonadales bacterium]